MQTMRHRNKLQKLAEQILVAAIAFLVMACNSDEPNDPNGSNGTGENLADTNIIINEDGSTSNGISFIPIDETSFYLDYVKYKIIESHLEVVGYDEMEISTNPIIYGTVTYKNIKYNTRTICEYAFRNCKKINTISLPNTLQSIEYAAFTRSSLTSISLPNNIRYIPGNAFDGCSSLNHIDLPDELIKINRQAFMGCTSLSEITLPEGLIEIGDYAFMSCTSLSSITFPENLYNIGNFAFIGCNSLTSISFPEKLTTIPEGAFSYCRSLTEITISKQVEDIMADAFKGCTSLSSIDLPENLKYIHSEAFGDCKNISKIMCRSKTPPKFYYEYGYEPFENITYQTATVWVLSGYKKIYEKSDGWKNFKIISENSFI